MTLATQVGGPTTLGTNLAPTHSNTNSTSVASTTNTSSNTTLPLSLEPTNNVTSNTEMTTTPATKTKTEPDGTAKDPITIDLDDEKENDDSGDTKAGVANKTSVSDNKADNMSTAPLDVWFQRIRETSDLDYAKRAAFHVIKKLFMKNKHVSNERDHYKNLYYKNLHESGTK